MKPRHRVLVVDDSAFARKVLREILSADPRLEVVGFARDGLDALEKIAELEPDVITLDLVMPELDGVGVLTALADRKNRPRVVIVTMSDADSVLGVSALEAGATDVVYKPTALATDRLYELEKELVEKVVSAAGAKDAPRTAVERPASTPTIGWEKGTSTRLVVIGASTGGPRAITEILKALPSNFPAPIAVVVHMPVGYTEAFAKRLDELCSLSVSEASDGAPLEPGSVLIARAGKHLGLHHHAGRIVVGLETSRTGDLYRPSVDALFESAAREFGSSVLGVVLTGMGNDGVVGARAIHAAGGRLIVEAESSCVVYGMPRAIADEGLGAEVVPLELMARTILERL